MAKIKARESQNVEYKSSWHDEYLKWICGFANAQGAVMYFGVDNASRPRNRNIANAFFKAGFIDAWGRGYKKIREGFEGAGLPMPKIESAFGGVMVTFQRNNVNTASRRQEDDSNADVNAVAEELTERQKDILEILRDVAVNVAVNTKYLSERMHVNRKTIQRDLVGLQEHRLVQWVGSDKTGHWEIVE